MPPDSMTLEQALELHKSGQLPAAEQAYRQHLDATPEDADALHLLGVLCQQRGDHTQADELIRRAIALSPENAQYHLSLGGVLMHAGDETAARASFEKALLFDPNSVQAHGVLGHLALIDGDAATAENRFRIGRRADDEDPLLLLGLGNVYLARNEPANAAKFLSRAAEHRPDDAAIQMSLGYALLDQGALAFAEKAFENALRLRPDVSLAKLFLARSKLRQDKTEQARAMFAELAESGEQNYGACLGLGDVANKQGHFARAVKFYRRARALDPAHPAAALAGASCLERIGDLAGAVEFLSAALLHSAESDELRPPLARLLELLGRADEAAQILRPRTAQSLGEGSA